MTDFRILLVDDEPKLVKLLAESLEGPGRTIVSAFTGKDAWRLFLADGADLVITDLHMESEDAGLELLRKISKRSPETAMILVTAFAAIEAGVKALALGALEYLIKPIRVRALLETVQDLESKLKRGEIRGRVDESLEDIPHLYDDILVGTHPGMRRIYELLPRIAVGNSNVLITGESGTGKEVFARAIHNHGARAGKPLVSVNCAALVDSLLESELFGIEKGVATDVGARRGKFEQADGGTIFLDEIGDMTAGTQAKVLRVLQEREFERVGGTQPIKVDIRVIAATHRDLEVMVKSGDFRQDLLYRLNIIRLDLPPLRERLGDLDLYCRFFLRRLETRTGRHVNGLSEATLAELRRHDWPGNVRELENVLERAMVLSAGDRLQPADLPSLERGATAQGGDLFTLPVEGILLEDLEKDLLRQALERANGNKSAAARLLGLTRRTIGYRLEKYGLLDGEKEV
ncbi:MAG: sigma-54-dependent Fis family transcriptional regulator [bacterium]|nr:sigma-54-dependent Fis family transcriptional regulator [bacterium]